MLAASVATVIFCVSPLAAGATAIAVTSVVRLVVNMFAHVPAWLDQAGVGDDDGISEFTCVRESVCVCV